MVPGSPPIPVLYIGGYSRSGSTLFQRMLGYGDDVVCVGEMWDVWRRSFLENQLCGCGRPFGQCDFWQEVVATAFGRGAPALNVEMVSELKQSLQHWSHVPLLFAPSLRPQSYGDRFTLYRELFARLYRAIHSVSGSRMIVDSSKVPQHAALLSGVRDIELHVVHLVRDSRATAFSWARKKRRPEIHWQTAFMAQYGSVRVAAEWTLANVLLRLLKPRAKTYTLVRYEDFVTRPWATIRDVRRQVGLADVAPPHEDAVVELGIDHTVSGNPNRFDRGAVRIRSDDEWRQSMRLGSRVLVTALTLPFLARLHYLGDSAANGRPAGQRG